MYKNKYPQNKNTISLKKKGLYTLLNEKQSETKVSNKKKPLAKELSIPSLCISKEKLPNRVKT